MNRKIDILNRLFLVIEVLVYCFVAYFSWHLFIQHTTIPSSDINIHISIIDGFVSNYFYIPHPGFYWLAYFVSKVSGLPYNLAVPLILTAFVIIIMLLTKKIIIWFIPNLRWKIIYVVGAVALNFMTAIYLPFFNENIYLGQWGPTTWHSATMLLLKPFALLSFWGLLHYIQKQKVRISLSGAVVSFLLLVSTYTKPSYIICLIPALIPYLLIFHFKNIKLYFNVFLILSPSLLLLLSQFVHTYHMNDTVSYFHDRIIFTNFGVMKLYSPNIFISTILALAFPLSVLIVANKKIINNHYLLLSWILVVVGFLQAGLIAEEIKFAQAAFIFGYIISLYILFVFSMIEYLRWFGSAKDYTIRPAYKILVTLIGLAHFFSGIAYYVILIQGKTLLAC